MASMNVNQLLEEIEVFVDNCRPAGVLAGSNMIKLNRDELLAMLEELRAQLPGELAESRQILNTKDSIIADAKAKGEQIVNAAAKDAGVMVNDNEIVAMANMRAEEIVKEAQEKADEIVRKARETQKVMNTGALEYTQEMMDGLEKMYAFTIEQEKKYFQAFIDRLQDDHKSIVENKHEVDLQLGQGHKGGRSKEDFDKAAEEE